MSRGPDRWCRGLRLCTRRSEGVRDFVQDREVSGLRGESFQAEELHLEGPDARPAQIFYSLYFAMTGLHAAHMVIGIPIILVIAWMAHRGRFSPEYHTPVELTGLYWHFVDIIWIFLFPLLYLIGRHH